MTNFFYVIIFIFTASLLISGFRTIRYLISVKKAHSGELFDLIRKWYGQTGEGPEDAVLKEIERNIDGKFENKIHKTSLLHFDEKFISDYLKAENILHDEGDPERIFEQITRTDLKKSKQSLKILSMAFGHKFTLGNYSYYNYWLILKGNYQLWKSGKSDPEGRKYDRRDVEEPFKVLEYYFGER